MLRCKKGDLAIMIRGGVSGSIVDVLEFAGGQMTDAGFRENLWKIAYQGKTDRGFGDLVACDEDMLPIRPDELKEEEEREVTA